MEQGKHYPVIIFNRGGVADLSKLDPPYASSLSRCGVITFASQYRETLEGTGKDEFGGNDVHDVIKFIDFAEQCAFADSEHILMWGTSRGSMMTYEVIRSDTRICAAIIISGIPDLVELYNKHKDMRDTLRYCLGGTPEEVPEEYEKRSAIEWADEINVPLLIFHTADVTHSPVSATDAFVKKLESYGKDYEYIRAETGGHGWSDSNKIWEFIADHLPITLFY